ncbi:hypothetical protein B0T26DRAFT_447229 [Lasiosphaeria miniovina]|uniref:Uncharacterized protein n=1 Tax=Lasiosphaeria miniovina TaxID=1954250 RepID=A0AA39ZZ37_9PEZI|nr:uncharacterized protein B0T26DRAFT_447229 [Lasiosphaeria miniovina]KAK0706307.1 hypothetical protein B0T26DRAFT_447229 [Lasiosphaeria miniovina]
MNEDCELLWECRLKCGMNGRLALAGIDGVVALDALGRERLMVLEEEMSVRAETLADGGTQPDSEARVLARPGGNTLYSHPCRFRSGAKADAWTDGRVASMIASFLVLVGAISRRSTSRGGREDSGKPARAQNSFQTLDMSPYIAERSS